MRSQQEVHGVVERKNQTRWCFSAADVGKREAKVIQLAALIDTNKDGQPSLNPPLHPPNPCAKNKGNISQMYMQPSCTEDVFWSLSFSDWAV